jgi:mRNA-degrading endonuclease toxin of MazEF toxin-antitoxin module
VRALRAGDYFGAKELTTRGDCQQQCLQRDHNGVLVAPVAGNPSEVSTFEARIEVRGVYGKAMVQQMMTADKQRLAMRIGKVSASEMLGIERATNNQLEIH